MKYIRRHRDAAASKKSEQNLSSPIHKLPDELLAYTFLLGCPKPDFTTSAAPGSHDPLPYQLLVSSICRLWRRISLESPALWSIIYFVLPFENAKMANCSERSLEVIGKRAGMASITLTLEQKRGTLQCSPACMKSIAELLHRSHSLKVLIYFPCSESLSLYPFTRDRYPRLQHLVIMSSEIDTLTPLDLGFTGVEKFNLHTLVCERRSFMSKQHCVGRTANPKIVIHNSSYVTDGIVEVFSNMSRLQELRIIAKQWDTKLKLSSFSMECLVIALRVERAPFRGLGVLPSLAHLTVHTRNAHSEGLIEVPIAGPSTMFSALQTLTSQERTYSEDAWAPFYNDLGTYLDFSSVADGVLGTQISFGGIQLLLQNAPNLIAVEFCDVNAVAVLGYLSSDLDGAKPMKLEQLRLIRLVLSDIVLLDKAAVLCVRLMQQRPSLMIEWWIKSNIRVSPSSPRPLAPSGVVTRELEFLKHPPPLSSMFTSKTELTMASS